MKPKSNYSTPAKDRCQTPPYALTPLLWYLKWQTVWEPAVGDGYLATVLMDEGYDVLTSDILSGQNFLTMKPELPYDIIISNPPFSLKHKFVERCYELGKPFALLVPVETIGTERVQKHMRKHGAEIMLLDKRVNFKMPSKGWDGQAQFPVLWLCWKVLPSPIVYGNIVQEEYITGEDEPPLKAAFKRMLPYQIPMFEGVFA